MKFFYWAEHGGVLLEVITADVLNAGSVDAKLEVFDEG